MGKTPRRRCGECRYIKMVKRPEVYDYFVCEKNEENVEWPADLGACGQFGEKWRDEER